MTAQDFIRAPMIPDMDKFWLSTPHADSVTQGKLYNDLFSSAGAEIPQPQVQRIQALIWFHSLRLEQSQLKSLLVIAREIQAMRVAHAKDIQRVDNHEIVHLTPVYEDLARQFSVSRFPNEETQAAFAVRLQSARQAVDAEQDTIDRHHQKMRQVIMLSRNWVVSLTPDQQDGLALCSYSLWKNRGLFLQNDSFGSFIHTSWDGGDFFDLTTRVVLTAELHMDVGGLWTLTSLRENAQAETTILQLSAITMMILENEQLIPALEVRLGERDPLAFAANPQQEPKATANGVPGGPPVTPEIND